MISFTDVQRALGLFADGVTGRSVPIDVVDDARSVWPWRPSSVDEEVVRVPAVAADRGVLRATVLHHTGFSEFGSLDDGHDERERLLATSPQPGVARRIYGMLEDRRIDAATRSRYPGARVDLDRILARTRAEVPREPPAGWRDALLESLQLHSLGEPHAILLDRIGPGRRRALAAILELVGPLDTPDDNAHAALAIGRLLDDDELELEGDPTFAVTAAVELDQQGSIERPDDRDRPDADLPRPPSLGMRQEEADDAQLGRLADIDVVDPDAPADADDEPAPGRRPATAVGPIPTDEHGARSFFYDEWDHVAQRHLSAWCRVLERRLDGDDRTFLGDVRRRHGALIGRLRRQLAFVRPEGWVRVHHADEGDELDLDAVIDAVVDRRTGQTVDDRLHVRRDRAARDVATAFLVDLSASTSAPLPADDIDEEPVADEPVMYRGGWLDPDDLPLPEVGRRILDVAKESVAVMCDALELLGDRHAVYGFSGEGRHHVDVHVAKDFADRASPATWAALSAMRSLKYTRMGPAVRHATARLVAEPSRTKLLVVISDGYPQDIDYGPVRGDREYGLQDTARALRDAIDAGVTPYCLTIDPGGHDYLRRMLPERSYVVIEDVHSLPQELATLYGSVASRSSRGW